MGTTVTFVETRDIGKPNLVQLGCGSLATQSSLVQVLELRMGGHHGSEIMKTLYTFARGEAKEEVVKSNNVTVGTASNQLCQYRVLAMS